MASDEQGERTEAPTQRKRDEARQQGQVVRSGDLSSAAILLAALVALNFMAPRMYAELAAMMTRLLDARSGPAWDLKGLQETFVACVWSIAAVLLPILLTVMVAAVLTNLMQVGFVISAEPLMPTLNKISPLAGFRRLFSMRSGVRLFMSLGKVAIVGGIGYMTIAGKLNEILCSAGLSFQQEAAVTGQLIFLLGIRVAIVLLVLALMDYFFQRWQHEQDIRMTKQELKEDLKRMEGDPQIRARRQRVARHIAMQRMSMEVPRSSVVVTNPTHFAVALLYEDGMNAPKVLAKGADFMALRIKQIAAASGVPIVERKPLAQALFKSCKVGDEVPVNMYKAVAEILAYVYELSRHKKIGRRIPAGVG